MEALACPQCSSLRPGGQGCRWVTGSPATRPFPKPTLTDGVDAILHLCGLLLGVRAKFGHARPKLPRIRTTQAHMCSISGPVGETAAQRWSIAHHGGPMPFKLWSNRGPTATAFGPTPANIGRFRPDLARIGRSSAAEIGQHWPDLGQTQAKVGPSLPRGWPRLVNSGPTVDNINLTHPNLIKHG